MRLGIKLPIVMLLCAVACGDDDGGGDNTGDGQDSDGQTGDGQDGDGQDGDGQGGDGQDGDGQDGDGQDQDGDPNPPAGEWQNVTSNLTEITGSECGNVHSLSAKPDEDLLIVGVALKGLWGSSDGGESWALLGDSDQMTFRATAVVFDPDNSDQYWVSGIYNAGGVYKTEDNGETFEALGNSFHHDLVSVDFTDPERQTLVAGSHERSFAVTRSDDGGATWTEIGMNSGLPDASCTWPHVIDADTYLVGCSYTGQGIYRTTNAGESWESVSGTGGSFAPLVASDGSIYWAIRDNGGLLRSDDEGLTWTMVTGPGVLLTQPPVELPDGRIAAVGSSTIVVSDDQGETWAPASAPLPYSDVSGFVYSAQQKAFFIKHFTCEAPIPADGVMRFDFDYESQ